MYKEEWKKIPLVLIDFWSPACGPCRAMKPALEKLENDFPEVKFVYCNIFEDALSAQMFQVEMLPTVIVLREGKTVYRNTGVIDYDALFDELESIVDAEPFE